MVLYKKSELYQRVCVCASPVAVVVVVLIECFDWFGFFLWMRSRLFNWINLNQLLKWHFNWWHTKTTRSNHSKIYTNTTMLDFFWEWCSFAVDKHSAKFYMPLYFIVKFDEWSKTLTLYTLYRHQCQMKLIIRHTHTNKKQNPNILFWTFSCLEFIAKNVKHCIYCWFKTT